MSQEVKFLNLFFFYYLRVYGLWVYFHSVKTVLTQKFRKKENDFIKFL